MEIVPKNPNDITWFVAFIIVLILMGGGFFKLLWEIIKTFVKKVDELIVRQEKENLKQVETNKSLIDAIQKLTVMVEVHEVEINRSIEDIKEIRKKR